MSESYASHAHVVFWLLSPTSAAFAVTKPLYLSHWECQPLIFASFNLRFMLADRPPLSDLFLSFFLSYIIHYYYGYCIHTCTMHERNAKKNREIREDFLGLLFLLVCLQISFSFLSLPLLFFLSPLFHISQSTKTRSKLVNLSTFFQSINQSIHLTQSIKIMESKMSSSSAFSLDHFSPSEQLCYVHCTFCDTVLAVSVPCSSLFKIVTVRCGHCTNLLSVNMRGLLLPAANQLHLGHAFFPPSQSLLEEIPSAPPNMPMDHRNQNESMLSGRGEADELPRPPVVNRPPEKRQRVPSAYNRFIKDEIQRIKAGNPDITHREAFSAAAKNWAHFPHIHFGLMRDQAVKKTNVRQQEADDVLLKDGFFASANVGVSPY